MGGVSVFGTFFALLGGMATALSAIGWIEISYIQYVILILSAGLFGSICDSFLGATIQQQNRCLVCNKVTEIRFIVVNKQIILRVIHGLATTR